LKVLFDKLKPYDYAAVVYSLIMGLIILIYGGVEGLYGYNLLALLAYIVFIILIAYFFDDKKGLRRFIRITYPLFSFTFLYEQTGQFINLIHQGYYDNHIIAFENMIFGKNPTILLQSISFRPLNELLYFCYFSYYFLLIVLGLYLYIGRKYIDFQKMITAASIAYFISYTVFILYPAEGPRYALAGYYYMKPQGYFFVPLVNYIINLGGLHGGCMPSSHVATAVVSTIISRRYAKKLFGVYLFLSIGLTIGTFWGRFHYVSDAVAGIIVGIFAVWLAERSFVWLKFNSYEKSSLSEEGRG